MNTIRKILEFILITLIFYALYNLSLLLHTRFFQKEDPALFVFASFVLSFLLILFYRFVISHGVKRRVREEVHQIYKTKEEKLKVLTESTLQKETQSSGKNQKEDEEEAYDSKGAEK